MTEIKTDIAIVGGGMVGLSLACSLARAGLDITVIEAADPQKLQEKKFDGRVMAVAYNSKKLFEKIGAWDGMAEYAGEILDIRITDNFSPLFLHYDHKIIGDEPMGHIIEARFIRKALFDTVKKHKNIRLLSSAKCKEVTHNTHNVDITLEDGRNITAKLLVAADGRGSRIRKNAGISVTSTDYNQIAIVCTVKHEKHHGGAAIEQFLPAGPFAILPMQGGYHSSLVWTEKTELAPIFMEMNDKDFTEQVAQRFGDYLGKIKIDSDRWSYPLSLSFAEKYVAERTCLVGDAAHGIHPISGQGFNLGIRDVEAISELMIENHRLGLDVGSTTILEKYQRIRRVDNMLMIAVTDSLNRLFSNNIAPIKLARRIGLATVNQIPPLKKIFMGHAMGIND